MCGICGAFQFSSQSFKVTENYINEMRDTMYHRGPDGAGTWVSNDGSVGLGHRRLAIIDLSEKALQPMSTQDGSLWLSYNGEIYNHREIREELNKSFNIEWKTDHSDTEVLLRAFEHWGIDAVEKFRGMFAFAIWDTKKSELWLVRDRIGIKPLYYSIHNGRLVFASEIKALLKDKQQERKVNEEAFYHFLSFLTTPAPNTLFHGIKKLPGGHWLRMNAAGEVKIHRYWDVWDHTKPLEGLSEDQIKEKILTELSESVQYRKESDVPVGVFLSGGVDSSTNAALFSDSGKLPIKTFSIGYDDEYHTYKNELHYAKRMAEEVNSEHYELRLKQDDLLNFLPEMVKLQDEPIADPVCVPVYFVSKLARDNGVIVCQVGEGADELYWGYESWKAKLKLQKMDDWPVPRWVKKTGLSLMGMAGLDKKIPYELLRRGAEGVPIFWGGAEAFTEKGKGIIMSPRLREDFKNRTSWEALEPIRNQFEAKAWEKSHLNWMSYLDLNYRLPELLLMRVDKMSMGVSLEGRVPFLDHKFVELSMSIPSSLKTKNNVNKYLLKEAVSGLVPHELIHRKKQGFGVPVYEWFFDRLGQEAKSTLKSFCQKTDFLSWEGVNSYFERKQGPLVWYLLNFAMWYNQYIDGE